MNIAFVGEVDHGKSSLIGRLLLDTKSLPLDKIKEFDTLSKELGNDACLAFLLDQFIEEREGLLTIDTTETVLKLENKFFVCIDTPGHLKFLKNMMTGASHADAAVIVVDARCGVKEQTLMHAHILEMFGIKSVIGVVNKMDLVDYQEEAFRLIEDAIENLSQKSGIIPQDIIPVSAQYGINIAGNSDKTKWYRRSSLVRAINQLKRPLAQAKQALRLPVQDIYRVDGHPVIVGRLSQGTIRKNQKVLVSPSMEETQIKDIKIFGQARTSAGKGENVGLCCSPPVNIKRGDVLCGLDNPLLGANQFQAHVLWLAELPPKKDGPVTVHIATQQLQCRVKSIERSTNTSTFNITLDTCLPAAVVPFTTNNELGRFTIEEKGERSGVGIITKILVALVFCITLLLANAFAQNLDDPFFNYIAKQTHLERWSPLRIHRHTHDRETNKNDLESLQALSYLQGYNPPPKFSSVTIYDRERAFKGYNLFVSSSAPEAILMDMNGKTIHRWCYPSASLPVDQRYCANYWARVYLLKNGGLLAMVPFGGLLKIDRNSHLLWFTKMLCHHDLDIDSDGNIYTLTVKNSRPGDGAGIKTNSIAILTPEGKIKKEISLYDLFQEYPDPAYFDRINALGRMKGFFINKNGIKVRLALPGDVFHANSIQVLDGKWAAKVPAFKKGNLLVSLRQTGDIICVNPDEKKITWSMHIVFWGQGQHSVKLLDNGNILLFDNDYRPHLSRVVEFDPAAQKIVWVYSRHNGRFHSFYLGQCYRLPNGNTLITESTNGHSFEVTPDKKIVWEFYNPDQIDKNSGIADTNKIKHFQGKYDKLIAVIYQMQRIAIDSNLDWLKN